MFVNAPTDVADLSRSSVFTSARSSICASETSLDSGSRPLSDDLAALTASCLKPGRWRPVRLATGRGPAACRARRRPALPGTPGGDGPNVLVLGGQQLCLTAQGQRNHSHSYRSSVTGCGRRESSESRSPFSRELLPFARFTHRSKRSVTSTTAANGRPGSSSESLLHELERIPRPAIRVAGPGACHRTVRPSAPVSAENLIVSSRLLRAARHTPNLPPALSRVCCGPDVAQTCAAGIALRREVDRREALDLCLECGFVVGRRHASRRSALPSKQRVAGSSPAGGILRRPHRSGPAAGLG
jgi:hypothetical protein